MKMFCCVIQANKKHKCLQIVNKTDKNHSSLCVWFLLGSSQTTIQLFKLNHFMCSETIEQRLGFSQSKHGVIQFDQLLSSLLVLYTHV